MEYRNITDGQTNLLSLSRVSILTRDKKTVTGYHYKSWLPISFLLHVKYTLSYRTVQDTGHFTKTNPHHTCMGKK